MPKAKSKKPFDKESLRKQYEEIYPKYEQLAKNLKQALEIFLEEKGFDYVGVFLGLKSSIPFGTRYIVKVMINHLNKMRIFVVHWKVRVCKIYSRIGNEWKMTMHTVVLEY